MLEPYGQISKHRQITVTTDTNRDHLSPLAQYTHDNASDTGSLHYTHNRDLSGSPSQRSTHTMSSTKSKKWAVPQPVRDPNHQRRQMTAFRGVTVTPIEKIRKVIGTNFANFVSMEFADVFNHKEEFTPICLQSAQVEDSLEYQRRHAFAEQIALTENNANVKRARAFLPLLADTWVVDQGFYHTTPAKKEDSARYAKSISSTRSLKLALWTHNEPKT